MRRIAPLVLIILAAALLPTCWRQSLRPYRRLFVNDPVSSAAKGVRATFLGVTSILFTDGETSILVDGYFSRPASVREKTADKIAPDPAVISHVLKKAGITHLDAIAVTHSHFDHALDTAVIAEQTGALVLGTKTTYWICKGGNLPDDRFREMGHGDKAVFGDFTVTFIKSRHVSFSASDGLNTEGLEVSTVKELTAPLVPPQRWGDYPEGGTYDIYITHPLGKALVHPSAGYIVGALDGYQTDVLFVGIAHLGNQFAQYRRAFVEETVQASGAKLVIPVHWDDYTQPLDALLRPIRRFVSDMRDGMAPILDYAKAHPSVRVELMQGYDTILIPHQPSPAAP